jgi:hypothetical protein
VAARKLGERLVAEGQKAIIVTLACDGASKYLSEDFWREGE